MGIANKQIYHSGIVKHFVDTQDWNLSTMEAFAFEFVPKPAIWGETGGKFY